MILSQNFINIKLTNFNTDIPILLQFVIRQAHDPELAERTARKSEKVD